MRNADANAKSSKCLNICERRAATVHAPNAEKAHQVSARAHLAHAHEAHELETLEQ